MNRSTKIGALIAGIWPAIVASEVRADQILYIAQGNNTVASVGVGGGAASVFSTGYSAPFGMAVDAQGNVYTSNLTGNSISVVGPGGGAATTFATGLNGPDGMSFDSSGNLFVANSYGNSISEISPSGMVTTFASGLTNPDDVVVDSAGNVYYTGAGKVWEIKQGGGSPVVYSSSTGIGSYYAPVGLAFDSLGNLYVSDAGRGDVFEISQGGGTASLYASGFQGPIGIAFDASNNLYVSNYGNGGEGSGYVSKVTTTAMVSTIATGLTTPEFLAISPPPPAVPVPPSFVLTGLGAVSGLSFSTLRRRRARSRATGLARSRGVRSTRNDHSPARSPDFFEGARS